MTHVYLRQRYQGIEVFDANINVNVARDGSIIALGSSFVRGLASKIKPGRTAAVSSSAIWSRRQHHKLGLKAPAKLQVVHASIADRVSHIWAERDQPGTHCDQARLPERAQHLRPGFGKSGCCTSPMARTGGTCVWMPRPAPSWPGATTSATPMTPTTCSRSRPRIPDENGRTLVVDPGHQRVAQQLAQPGALTPRARLRTQRQQRPRLRGSRTPTTCRTRIVDPNGTLEGTTSTSTSRWILTGPPQDYQDAAVTNLFYWNNVIHDVLLQLGFDEKSGNFQFNNFANSQGKDSNPVLAEAQDGSGRNNTDSATRPDGFSPQDADARLAGPRLPTRSRSEGSAPSPAPWQGSAPAWPPNDLGKLVLANDGTAPTSNGCEPFPANSLVGKIPLIDRGTCTFVVKVKNAQNAGAGRGRGTITSPG